MRTVSPALAAAIESRERQLLRPRLFVDWASDGFGAAGSIDDLSRHVVQATIDGALQSDLPDEVRLVQGNTTRTLSVTLGGGNPTNDAVPTRRYFSPVAANSTDVPLGGLERRGRPCYYETGFTTADGPAYVREFTGRTSNLPVDTSSVQLMATDNRALLREDLTLPALPAVYVDPVSGDLIGPGLEATWLVSYVLARNGVYASPPPRAAARLWAPMHGSSQPFIHDELGGLIGTAYRPADSPDDRCRFTDGPYVAALSSGALNAGAFSWMQATASPTGPDLFDQYGRSVGRIEAYVMIPAGVSTDDFPISLNTANDEGSLYLDPFGTSGFPELGVWAGQVAVASVTGSAVSGLLDGDWHFLGLWWDTIAGQWKVNIDGAVVPGTMPPTGTGGTSPGEDWYTYVSCVNGAALAEVHVTAGGAGTDPWLIDIPFTPSAIIDRSDNQLVGIVPDDTATDSWQLLQAIAEAERGAIYFDADGVARYRTPSALATDQAQTVQLTLTSTTTITRLTIEPDASRVRNVISCPWTQVTVHAVQLDYAYEATTVWAAPPGQTLTQLVTLKGPTLGRTLGIVATCNTKLDGTGVASGPVVGPEVNEITCGPLTITVTQLTSATARVDIANSSAAWRYLCDATGQAAFALEGVYTEAAAAPAPLTASDQDSIDKYGTVSLSLNGSAWRQAAGWAAGIAQQTLADTKDPLPAITNLEVRGDPRLEYYDRVRIADEDGTEQDGEFWVKSIRPARSGSDYRMTIAATAARDLALFDQLPGFDVGVFS